MPLITFEGIDGAGKSSTIARVSEALDLISVPHVVMNDFASVVSRQIKPEMVNAALPATQYALVLAARIMTHHLQLRDLLSRGVVVLYDRYLDSTLAYQGLLGISPDRILHDHSENELPVPVLTLVLDLPVATARARKGAPADKIEAYGDHFFEVVRAEFMRPCLEHSGRHVAIDARQDPELVAADCTRVITIRVLQLMDRIRRSLDVEPNPVLTIHTPKAVNG